MANEINRQNMDVSEPKSQTFDRGGKRNQVEKSNRIFLFLYVKDEPTF